jgi:hypothetical protein
VSLLWLMRAMFKEEFRLQSSYSSRLSTMAFPLMLVALSFIVAVSLPQLAAEISMERILLGVYASIMLYGLAVGAFSFLGREMMERRWGQATFLLSVSQTLPISFKRTLAVFFLKDLLYYIFMTLLPLTIGLLLSIPLTGFAVTSVLAMFGTMTATFCYAISFSFLMSSVYMRSRAAFTALAMVVIALVAGSGLLGLFDPGWVVPAIAFELTGDWLALAASVTATLAFAAWAVLLVEDRYEAPVVQVVSRYDEVHDMFSRFGRFQPYLAKEWIDLVRSKTLTKLTTAFVLPLVVLTAFDWFLGTTLSDEIEFSTIFYGGMVGFFGVLIYSWLNNIDYVEYYNTFPVQVPEIVKAKLIMFLILTSGISTVFVVVMTGINGDWNHLPLALVVMFATSIYMVVVTAYLTGLRTNIYLFDTRILARFAFLSIVPLMAITFLSMAEDWLGWRMLVALVVVCLVLATATRLLLMRIDTRWRHEAFTV